VINDLKSTADLEAAIQENESKFDFVMVDIVHHMNFRDQESMQKRQMPSTRSDSAISHSRNWGSYIIGKVTSHLVNCDSPYEHIRERSEAVINEEINYCMHLGVTNIVFQLPLT
jgi:hypothetical protein